VWKSEWARRIDKLKVLVLGCGMMGSVIAMDMAERDGVSDVVVADFDKKKPERLVARLKSEKISGHRIDVKDEQATRKLMKGVDIAVCALPVNLSVFVSKAAVGAGVHLVDLMSGDRPLELDTPARKAGITILVDCGVAPGITNILAGRGANLMDEVDNISIVCGGIPQKPIPPLGYKIVWSTEELINMYCGKVKIVRDGKISEVDAMSGLEQIEFSEIGMLEAFYTDGLSTLLHTMKGRVKNMGEKTARWPGHAQKILAMRDTGFFDTEPVEIHGANVIPREVAVSVLEKTLRLGEEKDLTALRVDVSGRKDGKEVELSFSMMDFFDETHGVTSMARTTGYTAAIVARMVARGEIKERGVIPPEIGVVKVYKKFTSELQERGIRIQENSRIKE